MRVRMGKLLDQRDSLCSRRSFGCHMRDGSALAIARVRCGCIVSERLFRGPPARRGGAWWRAALGASTRVCRWTPLARHSRTSQGMRAARLDAQGEGSSRPRGLQLALLDHIAEVVPLGMPKGDSIAIASGRMWAPERRFSNAEAAPRLRPRGKRGGARMVSTRRPAAA